MQVNIRMQPLQHVERLAPGLTLALGLRLRLELGLGLGLLHQLCCLGSIRPLLQVTNRRALRPLHAHYY